jgi:CelD/BcsL family acetyltransferase involved in cellulose biosynthesis
MQYALSITPIPDLAVLRALWIKVACDSVHTFFLSWQWIGTWLHCLGSALTPKLITISADGSPVALGILIQDKIWRRGILPVRIWSLNATGREQFDCICTEYNGLLAKPDHADAAWAVLVNHFASDDNDCDEFQLEGVAAALPDSWSSTGFPLRETRRAPSRFVRLADVRATSDKSCLSLLPSRARTRLRHTIASLQKRYGPLTVSTAQTRAEAHAYLNELKIHHNAKWGANSGSGAFDEPFAQKFHDSLVNRCFDDGVVQLARISTGTTTLGLLYNYVYRGQVLFYQSGINYAATSTNESPGLLIHVLMIDHNAALGHEVYDLLAGDSQYKRTLANHSNELWWGAMQKPRLKLKIEQAATKHYRTLRGRNQTTPT